MAQTKAHKKKRRSQAPIALVYFITMIIFLFVIGMLALYALREFGSSSRINSFQISTPHLTSGTRSTTAKEFSPLTSFQT